MNIYLDIETIPSQKPGLLEEIRAGITPPGNFSKPESIAKWMAENADAAADEAYRKTGLDGAQGEIVCIGYAFDDSPVRCAWRPSLDISSEREVLGEFFVALHEHVIKSQPTSITYVGHNVLSFDLRFLFQRAVINGIKPPIPLRQDSRYNGDGVYDTMLAWAGWGNRISLARLCAALGIPVKTGDICGSNVWDAFLAGRGFDIAEYCADDVSAVRVVHHRMVFSFPAV